MKSFIEELKSEIDKPNVGEDLMDRGNPWSTYSYSNRTGDRNATFSPDVTMEVVDRYGGEDQGSDYYTVYKFTKGDEVIYVNFYGWYASYDGSTYSGYAFVEPVEKLVIVYEAVEKGNK